MPSFYAAFDACVSALDSAITLLGTIRSNMMEKPQSSPTGMEEDAKMGGRVENSEEKGPGNVLGIKDLIGNQPAESNVIETATPGGEGKPTTAYLNFPNELLSPYSRDEASWKIPT